MTERVYRVTSTRAWTSGSWLPAPLRPRRKSAGSSHGDWTVASFWRHSLPRFTGALRRVVGRRRPPAFRAIVALAMAALMAGVLAISAVAGFLVLR